MSATLTTLPLAKQDDSLKRLHIQMHGAVLGVGFRPTVSHRAVTSAKRMGAQHDGWP
jgi:hypothetical protein